MWRCNLFQRRRSGRSVKSCADVQAVTGRHQQRARVRNPARLRNEGQDAAHIRHVAARAAAAGPAGSEHGAAAEWRWFSDRAWPGPRGHSGGARWVRDGTPYAHVGGAAHERGAHCQQRGQHGTARTGGGRRQQSSRAEVVLMRAAGLTSW